MLLIHLERTVLGRLPASQSVPFLSRLLLMTGPTKELAFLKLCQHPVSGKVQQLTHSQSLVIGVNVVEMQILV